MRIIGLDVGEKRIGVSKADSGTRIAVPVGFVNVDGSEWQEIAQIARLNSTNFFVLGLPRSNEGNETQQSVFVRQFAKTLTEKIPRARVQFQDESLTSVEAEERLKQRKKNYEKGDIDAEAAAIILQDFMERVGAESASEAASVEEEAAVGALAGAKKAVTEAGEAAKNLTKKEADKVKLNTKKVKHKMKNATKIVIFSLIGILVLGVAGCGIWFNSMISPVTAGCTENECEEVYLTVNEGDSRSIIADNLESSGAIKSSLAFMIYHQLFNSDVGFMSGDYVFNKGQNVSEIISILGKGPNADRVFDFTIKPGETIYDIQDNLISLGYPAEEVADAFQAKYDFDFLKGRPEGATLEGYLFGETHEFYNNTPVREIIETFLTDMEKVIKENDLEAKYQERGLNLFEGITLASVVQKESGTEDMPTVAQVFLTRLENDMMLGSDVTVSYALDTLNPDRVAQGDNSESLVVDSCYNTRLYRGLPCGPISNPGISALLAVANPTDTSYLYFLTGDDGLMYYSYTEDEHIQNIYSHCQDLCSVAL